MSRDALLLQLSAKPHFPRLFAVCLLILLLSACATQRYQHQQTADFPIADRAVTKSQTGLVVSASVPSDEEATAIFGVPIYKRGIQPVWLSVTNNNDYSMRFAPSSLDRIYFSPLEVSFMHRKGFNKEQRAIMDKRFYNSALPRIIPENSTVSGYVFTHADPGTKSFNVEFFSNQGDANFAFFVTVPGFVPDYAGIDFKRLYQPDEIRELNIEEFRSELSSRTWLTSSETGEPGLPINIVIVASGLDVLKALLRAGWHEKSVGTAKIDSSIAHYTFGRTPDATFGIMRSQSKERNELYLWKAPIVVNGEPVWVGRVSHAIGRPTQFEQVLFGAIIDPDIDEGSFYFVQNVWYSQGLRQNAWLKVNPAVPFDELKKDFNGTEYFTDGYIGVSWLSGESVSVLETKGLDWDPPPFR